MRKMLLICALIATAICNCQVLTKDESTGKFTYTEVISEARDIQEAQNRLKALGYTDLVTQGSEITGRGFLNEQVNGGLASFGVEIYYQSRMEFKDDKYKITLSNFHVKDVKQDYILEDMGRYQKKWFGRINERLPKIVSDLKIKYNDKW